MNFSYFQKKTLLYSKNEGHDEVRTSIFLHNKIYITAEYYSYYDFSSLSGHYTHYFIYFLNSSKSDLLLLTFFCNCMRPKSNPSAVGGQPGT